MYNNNIEVCPACNNSAKRYIFLNNFRLCVCNSCGLVFWHKNIELSNSQDKANIFPTSKPYKGEFDTLRWGQKLFLKLEHFESKVLLDFGCGNGNFLSSCEKHNIDAIGCESNEILFQFCIEQNHNVVYNTRKLPDASFDYITMWEVLEHLNNPIEVIEDLKRCLKPNGQIILSTPNRKHPAVSRTKLERYWPPHHITFWDKKSLISFLQKQGFQITNIYYRPFQKKEFKQHCLRTILHELFLMRMEIVVSATKGGQE